MLDKCADVQGVSAGWGIENDLPLHYLSTAVKPSAGGEQKKGCLFFALIGWESVRAVMEFREMREYEKHIQLLTEMEGCIALSTFTFHARYWREWDERPVICVRQRRPRSAYGCMQRPGALSLSINKRSGAVWMMIGLISGRF